METAMLEREVIRKYRWELGLSLVVYGAVLVGSLLVARRLAPGALRTVVALLPAIPVGITVWVIARQFGRLDEFQRLRSLESIAVAAAVTAGLTFTYGFLEGVGFPKLSMFWVWGIMGITWGLHSALRSRFS
jgi:hypothetical protein